jgi:hypothetical protein
MSYLVYRVRKQQRLPDSKEERKQKFASSFSLPLFLPKEAVLETPDVDSIFLCATPERNLPQNTKYERPLLRALRPAVLSTAC